MEKFFKPTNSRKFVKWLLEEAISKKWIIVLEHTGDEGNGILQKNATVVELPISAELNYNDDCKLTAVINPTISDTLVDNLLQKFHVLSVHDATQQIFLIADDFHPECFSCSLSFYHKYETFLQQQGLVKVID